MHKKIKYKQRELIVILISLFVCIILGGYGLVLSNRVTDIESQWTEYDKKTSLTVHLLGRIKDNFGYGGFIHNFKNYVLRQDPLLVEKLNNDLNETYLAIAAFPADHDHEYEEVSQSIAAIKTVVDQYAAKFELAQKLVAEKRTAKYIDQLVRVDDRPAMAAFLRLNQHVLRHSQGQIEKTSFSMERTLAFLSWGLLLLPVIFITAAFFIGYIRHNALINQQLTETSAYMTDLFDAAPDAILIIDHQGEIKDANLRAIEFLGYSKEQLLTMTVEDLIPERFRQSHVHMRDSSFENPKRRLLNTQTEFIVLKSDHSEVPVDISINHTLKNEQPRAITILRDVSEQRTMENSIKHNENLLKKAQSLAHIGSWEWKIKENTLSWSDEIFTVFGLNADQFGASYDRFVAAVHPDDRDDVVNAVNETVVYDKPYDIDHRILRPDGEVRYVHERGDVYRDESGEAVSMVGTVVDITEQVMASREMRLADNVFSHTTEAIIVTDAEKNILRVNDAFTQITGYSADEALGKKPEALLSSGEHDDKFYQELWQCINLSGKWEGEIIDRRKSGEAFPCWHNISAITDEHGEIIQYTSIFSDITEKKKSEERIQNLAQYDQLTQLPNRVLFNDRLQHAITRSKRSKDLMGLMFIDLDGFKAVNDSLGHQAGDDLLQQVAKRLSACVREQDTVARLGGDEFTVILESLSHIEDAALVANKVLKSLSKKIIVGDSEANIGASIGISIFPDDGVNAELIVKRADIAMYIAKKNGKHQYQYYSPEMES